MKRRKPLRSKEFCHHCGKTLCSCGEPPKLKRTPMRARNPARAAEKYERNFGDWADEVREMPCWWCRRPAPSDPAHTKGRQMGGAGGDRRYLLPLCGNDPVTGHAGCHHKYDNHELDIDHRLARLAALRMFLRAHPGDAMAETRIHELEGAEHGTGHTHAEAAAATASSCG